MSVDAVFYVKGYVEYNGGELEYAATIREDSTEITDIIGSYPERDGDEVEKIEALCLADVHEQVKEWKGGG